MTGEITIELIPESTKEELLNPSANLVGQAVRGALHVVLDPFVRLNIVREKALKDFEEKVHSKNEAIPLENRDDSKIGLALKALEDSKYQLDSDVLREMFSNLITSTLDNRLNNSILPSFSSILKDMCPQDARLLMMFSNHPIVPLITIRLEVTHGDTGIAYIENILLFPEETIHNELSVTSLLRLGLIRIDSKQLHAREELHKYANFIDNPLYKQAESLLPHVVDADITLTKVTLVEASARLTVLGTSFLQVIA